MRAVTVGVATFAVGLLGLLMPNGEAAVLLDLGAGTAVPSPNPAISPGHTVGGIVGTTWNNVTTADTTAPRDDANVLLPTALTINIGKNSTTALSTVDFALTGYSQNRGVVGGLYTNSYTSTFSATPGLLTDQLTLAVKIGGLAPGQYDVYVVSHNTYTAGGSSSVGMGTIAAAATTIDLTASGLTYETVTNPSTSPSTWTEGVNYTLQRITVAAGQHLVVTGTGTTALDRRGYLNTIEIVPVAPVPEPASVATGAIGAAAMLMTRRRRRQDTGTV